jgi:cobalt-zinc-cadmium efflux system membrane fusion protein
MMSMDQNLKTHLRFVGAFALALFLALLAACRKAPSPEPETSSSAAGGTPEVQESVRLSSAAIAEAGITTWKVEPVELAHLVVLNGTVNYDENRLLHLAANVKGRVAEIAVDLGARVRAGDPVLRLESVELGRAREELVRELAELAVAERAFQRARVLADAKAISTGELQAREGEYLIQKVAAEAAERTLHVYGEAQETIDRLQEGLAGHDPYPSAAEGASLTLRAPFAGLVIDRKVTPGALFEALQPLVTIADLSTVWVFLQAYEKDLALLHEGLPATIRSEAYPQASFRGNVDFVSGVMDPASRTVRVRASVPNSAERLRPGMFVTASVEVPRPAAESHAELAVPQAALQTLDGRTVVFVQVEPGVFVRRHVETGHTFEGFTEVLAGLKAGEAVVTEGSFVLKSEFARALLVEED